MRTNMYRSEDGPRTYCRHCRKELLDSGEACDCREFLDAFITTVSSTTRAYEPHDFPYVGADHSEPEDDGMDDQERKDWIDAASYEDLLRKWRFGKVGDPFFKGDVGEHYKLVMNTKRGECDHVAISKKIGWDG